MPADALWMVYSPTIWPPYFDYGEPRDPPEPYAYVCEVEAPTRAKAKARALRHPDMRGWVDDARGDGVSPFTGLTAVRLDGEEEPAHDDA